MIQLYSRKLVTVLLLFGLFACTSQEEQKAMNDIAQMLQPEKITLGSETSVGSKNIKCMILTIKGGEVLNNSEISDANILSMGVLAFYSNLDPVLMNAKEGVKIKLERNLNGTIKTIEGFYAFDTLGMVKATVKNCIQIGNDFVTQKYDHVYEQLYFDIKEKVSENVFKKTLVDLDSTNGKVIAFKVTQFSTHAIEQMDGSILPLVHYTMEVNRNSIISIINFKFNLNENKPGILDLSIE